jgi:hypothetical protein
VDLIDNGILVPEWVLRYRQKDFSPAKFITAQAVPVNDYFTGFVGCWFGKDRSSGSEIESKEPAGPTIA